MSKQSKTLRQVDEIAAAVLEAAAAELRRLHAQRDALLEALRKHVYLHDKDCVCEDCAAIKAVEEGT